NISRRTVCRSTIRRIGSLAIRARVRCNISRWPATGLPRFIRVPREWLKTPDKEVAAKKLIQDQYVDSFASQLQQVGLTPKRSSPATQISGADAQGVRVRAVMDGEPGGMDSYFNITSDRLVQMSIIGSEKEIAR